MWATYPKMQEALDLIEAWGFTYKSIAFQWVKQNRSGNGELVVAEMVPQVPGQLNMDGTQQEQPKLLKLVTHA